MLNRRLRWVVVLLLAGLAYWLNRSGAFEAAISGLTGLGPWAKPAFVLLHAVSVLAMIPSVVPALAAGAAFGVAWGLPLSLLGAGLGALAAFVLGRTTARPWVERRFRHEPRFRALSRAAAERGWKIVALARLTPVFPFSIGNYAFGVTSMRGRDYMLATMLGTIPSNAVYVYVGAVAGRVTGNAGSERTPAEWALLVGGLVSSIALVLYMRRVASEALGEESDPTHAGEDATGA